MIQIYVDITGELVIAKQRTMFYPAYSELKRIVENPEVGNETISISSFNEEIKTYVWKTKWQDLTDGLGTPYASFQAVWDAITPYFDDQTA